MNIQRIGIAALSFSATTGLLYLIGHIWTVSSLMFHYEYQDEANGFSLTCGSFLPVLIGLGASFITEKSFGQARNK
ncbi:hypothetical protein QWY14_14670 [Planococcus sp. N028]|uniref:Uncharacterized protein n=1 Tax=Planococcus shixiaomingii TaxID=3058393 RepID=A0ABT8N579_9BACL|nr:hypothetical protein [Planococcus sp. N028]MDN7243045.1 hypothetical protein [Planococcus sp. N028]